MAVVSYTRGNDKYTIEPITDTTQASLDMDTVRHVIWDTDESEYLRYMFISIKQQLAYALFKNGERVGFVYNMIQDGEYITCSIHIWDPIAMILGVRHIFDIHDSHKVKFAPHADNLKDFISMAAGPSIRIFHTTGIPTVYMLRSELYPKGERMLKYLGVTNG